MPKQDIQLHFLAKELLQTLGLSSTDALKDNQWVFGDALKKLPAKQLSSAILDFPYLQVKYHVLCATLIKNAQHYNQAQQKSLAASILLFSEVLERIHLQSTQLELHSLQRSQEFCRDFLTKTGLDVPKKAPELHHDTPIDAHEEAIRTNTQQADFWRLIVMRGRRMVLWSIPLINNFEYYGRFMTPLDNFLRTLLVYQALVLLPRFLTNLHHLFKHWWSPNENEQALSDLERHQAHLNMNARWWELAYDFGWIALGLLNAFVLTGPLATFAAYTIIIQPTYNLILHSLRLFIGDSRIQKMQEQYKDNGEMSDFLELLDEHRTYNQYLLSVKVFVSIFIVSTGAVLLFSNMMPASVLFTAALISVLATIAGKMVVPKLPKQQDQLKVLELDDSPSPLLRNTMFSNKKDDDAAAATSSHQSAPQPT